MIEMWELERERGAPVGDRRYASGKRLLDPSTSDLHAWSIFRQNLNSDFTDSALGAEERSPLPYGNFTLKEETVHSIMRNPRLGPRSELASNAFSYLKFGLPRVLPPSGIPTPAPKEEFWRNAADHEDDCSETGERREREGGRGRGRGGRPAPRARSATDLRHAQTGGNQGVVMNRFRRKGNGRGGMRPAHSEGNILSSSSTHLQPEQASLSSVWLGSGGRGREEGQFSTMNPSDRNGNTLPHLQVRGLVVMNRENVLLENISFQLRGGDMMALMTTNASEGTALLEVLAGKRSSAAGQFFLNGNPLTSQRLGRRIGFLRRETELHPELSPRETLQFYSAFKKTVGTPSRDKVESILEMLGLSGVGSSRNATLTPSEKKRVALGCQLIAQTQILLLDSPTEEMDIFDTFFLMNVVDEWTKTGDGGIAICTIHPPTFEVFSTFSKLLLLSGGRTIFYGHRTELLPYFAFIDYPCPPFKNPSDYYIDLVTRDDLSSEALQESTMRIQGLAEAWARRQGVHDSGSESGAGQPHPLPPPIRGPRGAILGEIYLISRYLGLFGCGGLGWRLFSWFLLILASTSISVILGGIFWDVRLGVPAHVNSAYDRMGLNYALIGLLPLPVFLLLLAKERRERAPIQSDIQEGLYSQAAAYLSQRIGELFGVFLVLVGYVVPAMAMGGVRDVESLLLTSAYAILCLYTSLAVIRGIDLLFSGRGSLTLGGIFVFIFTLSSGYVLHGKDMGEWVGWTRFVSPHAWLLPPIAKIEFRNTSFEICSNPIVQLRGNLLMRELSCGLSKGENVMTHFDLPSKPIFLTLLVPLGIILIADLIGFVAVITRRKK